MRKQLTAVWIAALCCLFITSTRAQEAGNSLGETSILEETVAVPDKEKWWSGIQLSGYLKNEIAYRVREPRSITKIRNIALLNADYSFTDSVNIFFSGWAYYDLAYDIYDYDTIAARLERDTEEPLAFIQNLETEKDSPVAAIRELYFDMSLESLDLRVGKQYVVWGVLEGVRIVDEINPMDFRELITPDLMDYRIPLWSVKLDYYADIGDVQVLLIPDLKFHKPAPAGSEWELLQDVPGTRKPDSWKLENSELGLRLTTDVFNTEVAFSYFYTWDDFPVVFRTIKIEASSDEEPVYFPTYTRMSMYGMTAVKPAGDYILKTELAYVKGKFFGRNNVADINNDGYVDTNGEAQKDHIRWGLGLDFVVAGWDMAVGVTQWYIIDYEDTLIQSKTDDAYNIFVRREFPERSMTIQGLMIYLREMNEIYIKPKAIFQITDQFQMAVGMDFFEGATSDFGVSSATAQGQFNAEIQRAQFLGNFHNNDRVFFEFKYAF